MKKVFIFISFLLCTLVLTSCASDSVYISGYGSSGYGDGRHICISMANELPNRSYSDDFVDNEKIGNKTVSLYGNRYELTYVRSRATGANLYDIYETDSLSVYLNTETGRIIRFKIKEQNDQPIFPEGYTVKDKEIESEDAKKIAIEIVKNNYPDVNIENCKISVSDVRGTVGIDAFKVEFRETINGIYCESIHIGTDVYGNIVSTSVFEYAVKEKLPNVSDEQYIEMAKERIEEFYSRYEIVTEISDYEIAEFKESRYFGDIQSWGILYEVSFTVFYRDGTKCKFENCFVYPYYDESSVI